MDKIHTISEIKFDSEYLIVNVDNQVLRIRMNEVSPKLALANDFERNDFKITPSGYGIHWPMLDEDLSINGLLRITKK